MKYAESFKDLTVYRKAQSLAKQIFGMSRRFPRDEAYALTDQVRRSSRSIGAQIAEAWGKRRYEKHFVSKLTDADSEQYETQHWIDTAQDCGYLTRKEADDCNDELDQIGRMLNGMIGKSHLFCGATSSVVKESSSEYFVPS